MKKDSVQNLGIKNFIIDNKKEKIQDKLYFNGFERSQIITYGVESILIKNIKYYKFRYKTL